MGLASSIAYEACGERIKALARRLELGYEQNQDGMTPDQWVIHILDQFYTLGESMIGDE